VKLDIEIYKGSIFDGTFIQNKNGKTFVLTDVYSFKGERMDKTHLDSKLLTVMTYLKSNYSPSNKDNDLTIIVNKLYQLDEVEHLTNVDIPKITDFMVRGLCFYPEVSGTKLIYSFGNENKKDNSGTGNQSQQYENRRNTQTDETSPIIEQVVPKAPEIKKAIKTAYIPKDGKDHESYVFKMEKTDTIDVYILIAIEEVANKVLKKRKIGLAFVPNKTRSKWCSETIEKYGGDVNVNCKYHKDNHKWEPISISTSKRPSFIDEFDLIRLDD
jgi:hypothetical protein